jgi:hypothetical protein
MEQTPLRALDSLQHRLSQLISEPSGVEAALTDAGELTALVRGDGVPPVERVAVYANAYFARLHDCLREDFGALALALGADAFHDLVKTYLMAHPPARPSLRHAGAQLAAHLAVAPFAEIFARRCAYASDLARLEWAIAEAFTALDAPVLARKDLAAVAPDAWADLGFETVPSLQILTCAWPVQSARERFEAQDDGAIWSEAPALAPEPTAIRVWRRDERVRYARISALEREALGGIQSGESFSALCERVSATVGEAEAAAQAAAFVSSWIADGLLARVLA